MVQGQVGVSVVQGLQDVVQLGWGAPLLPEIEKKEFRNSSNKHRYSLEKRSFYAELQNIFGIDEIYN